MSGLGERLRSWLGRERAPGVRVHVLIRGRIGAGWYDLDEQVTVPVGTTLGGLVDGHAGVEPALAEALAEALAQSPHLAHTLMLNGERCPVVEHRERVLEDGDELYLLAPIAGG
ncbi:MoaD/ThiS family protein [Haliangium sp.]|uniref:MoaD/ThiS family protein n=1 Tax=Haliangium sp. TaxID=2663208 RepID=UPI003D0C0DFC